MILATFPTFSSSPLLRRTPSTVSKSSPFSAFFLTSVVVVVVFVSSAPISLLLLPLLVPLIIHREGISSSFCDYRLLYQLGIVFYFQVCQFVVQPRLQSLLEPLSLPPLSIDLVRGEPGQLVKLGFIFSDSHVTLSKFKETGLHAVSNTGGKIIPEEQLLESSPWDDLLFCFRLSSLVFFFFSTFPSFSCSPIGLPSLNRFPPKICLSFQEIRGKQGFLVISDPTDPEGLLDLLNPSLSFCRLMASSESRRVHILELLECDNSRGTLVVLVVNLWGLCILQGIYEHVHKLLHWVGSLALGFRFCLGLCFSLSWSLGLCFSLSLSLCFSLSLSPCLYSCMVLFII